MPESSLEWKGKTVLVTGATGMLGRSVTLLLQDVGANVVALVRDPGACPEARKALVCDLSDGEALAEQFKTQQFDFVFHLAAQSQVDGYDPKITFESNVTGTFNLLEALRLVTHKTTLIVASTDAVNRRWPELASPIANGPQIGIYPATKMCAEILAHSYGSSLIHPVGVVRLTNLYGPYDRNMRRLVPGAICSVLKDQLPAFRSDPQTPINLLYVDDAAKAILKFAYQIANDLTSLRTVTARSKSLLTLRDLVDAILTHMERPDLREELPPVSAATSGGVNEISPEISEDWGWQPQVTLKQGLTETINWYQQNFTE